MIQRTANWVTFTKRLSLAVVAGASLLYTFQSQAAGTWDGDWIVKTINPELFEQSCVYFELKGPITIGDGIAPFVLHPLTEHLNNKTRIDKFELRPRIGADGRFETWITVPLRSRTQYKIYGRFSENAAFASYSGNISIGPGGGYTCVGNFELARKDTLEAKSLKTNVDLEVLKLEEQVAKLSTSGQLRHTPTFETAQIDPSKPYDGDWRGIAKSDDPNVCRITDSIQSITVKDFSASIKLESGTANATVSPSGRLSKWLNVEIYDSGSSNDVTLNAKIDGVFSDNKFEGGLAGNLDSGNVCSATVKLGPAGSIYTEALVTGKNPRLLALQRQIAAAQAAPANDDNQAARAEAERLTAQRKTEEKRLAKLRADQEATRQAQRALESARKEQEAELAAQRRAEEQRLAKLRADQETARQAQMAVEAARRKQEAQLAAQREAEEKQLARLRAEQEAARKSQEALLAARSEQDSNIASQRKAEEQLLAKLRAEQKAARQAQLTLEARRKKQEADLAAQRKAEEQRLAKLRADQEAARKAQRDLEVAREQQVAEMAAKRKAEEQRLAKLRADQEQEAARRQAELEARLAKLEEDAKRKAEELAALSRQQAANVAAKPKFNVPANIKFGDYHALVIGINDYENLVPLKTAVTDAEAVAEVLATKYGFKVKKLINPDHEDILDTLDELRETLKFKDNLLVYYAGHGWLDEKGDEGYWLAANAKKNRRSRWVSNASITTTLRALEAKHVLVVADSYYSGRLVRDANIRIENADTPEYYSQISRKKARVVITSGGLEPVEDGKGRHSPFARAFLKSLNENNGVLDGSKLFSAIRRPVIISSNQTPQYSDVRRAGHDGGDFLFVRRR